MLICPKGNIVFKGHPAQRKDLVSDFDTLLAGNMPEGCVPYSEGGEGPSMPECKGTDKLDAINVVVDDFANTTAKALQAEFKGKLDGCPRAFCVMVTTTAYEGESDSFKTDFKNFRVLVGPADKIDPVVAKLEETFAKHASEDWFQVENRVHKM